MKIKNLKERAAILRQDIFTTALAGKTGHIAPAFSCVEIFAALYFGGILKYDPMKISADRDRVILSKGHACLALYAALANAGFFAREELLTFCCSGSRLGGHPKLGDITGVEASTGALGHGLSFGIGIALAGLLDSIDYHVYVILGDGECQEGSVWEGAMSAPALGLKNLTVVVDHNKLQAMDRLNNIVEIAPLADKWRAFGWQVEEVDGHNLEELLSAFNGHQSAPKAIIAHTVKGKGVSFMEDVPLWHFRFPNESELEIARKELGLE